MIEIEIVVDNHRHEGKAVSKGTKLWVSESTAQRLVNMRQGRLVEKLQE